MRTSYVFKCLVTAYPPQEAPDFDEHCDYLRLAARLTLPGGTHRTEYQAITTIKGAFVQMTD